MSTLRSPDELRRLRARLVSRRDPNRTTIVTSVGTCGLARGAQAVAMAIQSELKRQNLVGLVDFRATGCHGFCEIEPVVVIYPERVLYQHVTPDDISEIVSESVVRSRIVERLLFTDLSTGRQVVHEQDIPFYRKQYRLLTDSIRLIDPLSIDDYIATGGYFALPKVLFEMAPVEVIDEIRKAGLRGRGGAGFHTARKWEVCRRAPSPDGTKHLICNADEGDPGAYMDRSLLEGNPHSVIEGMLIGAFAMNAHQGYVYVRNEYPLAIHNLGVALEQAKRYGLLGKNILGSGLDFDLKISRGGGAFVCGESTALMASLEGRIGEPRPKHIHTALKGLYDRPTNLNNVETWANVPIILNHGADWYSRIGSSNSKGTKIFSLVGKVRNTGLVEVPMGITLREMVYDIGGGLLNGRPLKAIQTGGPSGGCIPTSLIDLPVDFDKLAEAGSMMGSGGMIVMDESTCSADLAKYFTKFLTEESCGKCVPCREGLDRMLDILIDITEGRGSPADIDLLEELGNVIKEAALCGLGGTAPNPVLSTLRYFKDEYMTHVIEKRCPAGVCKTLITFSVDASRCTGCQLCARECPQNAISGHKREAHFIDQAKCTRCRLCHDLCQFDAVIIS